MTNRRTLHRRRTTGWLAAGAILLVTALTGCLRVDMDLSVSDETINGSLLTALDRDFTQLLGIEPEDVFAIPNDGIPDLEGVSVSPYTDGNFAGVVYEFDRLTLSEWDELASADEQLPRFVYDATEGTYQFDLTVDLTDWFEDADELDIPEADLQKLRGSFEYQVSIAFPGEVIEHNGELSGTSVTWRPTLGELAELRAVAYDETTTASGSDRNSSAAVGSAVVAIVGVILFVAVAAGGVITWLVLRRRAA